MAFGRSMNMLGLPLLEKWCGTCTRVSALGDLGTARLSDDRLKKAEACRDEFATAGLPRCILVNDREPLVTSRPQRQHQAPTCLELFEKGRRGPRRRRPPQELVGW